MLGIFNLLPLLKGWEYKTHTLSQPIVKGAPRKELPVSERGWLISFVAVASDCQLMVGFDAQGAELQTFTNELSAQDLYDLGAFAQDPGGWLQQYYRPSPQSTAGIYVVGLLSTGFQGNVWAYIPTVKIYASLKPESTQSQATVMIYATVIAITDLKAFIRSFRSVQAIKDMDIDPQLLELVATWEVKEGEGKS